MLTTSTEKYMIDDTKSQYKGMNNDSVNVFNDKKFINSKDPGNAHACSSRIKTAEKLYDHNDHENNKNFQSKAESLSAVKRPSLNMAQINPSNNKMVVMNESPSRMAYKNKNRLMTKCHKSRPKFT